MDDGGEGDAERQEEEAGGEQASARELYASRAERALDEVQAGRGPSSIAALSRVSVCAAAL